MLAPKPLNSGASRARFLAFTRTSGLAIALTALGYAATYSANVMLARYLAPEHYGDFAVGFAACVQASTLVLLGFGRAVIRFVPQYLRKGHRHSASGIIFIAFAVSLALGLVVPAFGSLLLVVPYSGFSDGSPHWAIYALWIVALYAFLDITAALLRSTGRPMLSIITYYIAPPLIFIAFIFLFATLTVRVDGLVLFATLGLTYMVVVAMTLLYLPRNLFFPIRTSTIRHIRTGRFEFQSWMKIAIPIMASQFLLRAGDYVGLFVLEIFDPNENEVGYLAAARQTSELLNIAYAAMLVLVMPQLGAIASDHGTEQERQRLFGQSTAIVFSLTTICALPMILAPQPVMAIFGRNFAEGAAYLVPLALGALLIGGFGIGNSFLTFLGHGKALVRLLIWVVIIIIPVTMVLTRTFGGLGTAYSKLIYAIILTVGVLFLLWRRERLLPFRS